MIASLYWLHLPEHTDMFTQGYIGITTRTIEDRLYEHANSGENSHISNAIAKYGSKIKHTIILVGTKDYCLGIEEKLRPTDHIGWNIVKGGGCPPSWKGIEKTLDHRAKIASSKRGKKRKPYKFKSPSPLKGRTRVFTEEHKEAIRLSWEKRKSNVKI